MVKNYEKNIAIWIKIEDLKNIRLNALPVYDDKYLKTKIRTCGDNVYTNFRDFTVSEDDIECESFAVISIDLLLVYDNINLVNNNNSKECMICHYGFFNHGFKFQDSVCNGCHVLTMLSVNISNIAIITIENVDYYCIIHNISKLQQLIY